MRTASVCSHLLAWLVSTVLVAIASDVAAGDGLPRTREDCRRSLVFYYPDTVGRDHGEIARRVLSVIHGPLSARFGKQLQGFYFTRRHDLETFMDHCGRVIGQFPLGGMLHAELALEKKDAWELQVFARAVVEATGDTQIICVVVRRGSGIKSLEDLRGRVLMTPEFWDPASKRPREVVFENKLSLTDFAKLEAASSSISALTGMAFKQADAALVSNRVFELFRERFPQMWRVIESIHESQPIPINLFVGAGNLSAGEVVALRTAVETINTSAEGIAALEYVHTTSLKQATWQDVYPALGLSARAR
ncbi:MAG: PhnD/SsuA/transferrin family substrate-binding protein [Candidatus Schekmanbacteria bacterium]|nr:PhnD/SsuA/transferrin family substrate-binding protein [Candidatus Schekmanbacteria bacterium]